jgi:predicted DNA-binding protein (MmcQ/YjbR family)
MNVEEFRTYCLQKNGVTESFPFDNNTLVFKVLDKMFALTSLDSVDFKINLKCNPNRSIELRERYYQIISAYHMNKKHWNTILVNSEFPKDLLIELIDHSYDLVVAKMTKKNKGLLENLSLKQQNNKQQ